MSAIENLHNRIDLVTIPFTDRGSRLLVFRKENELFIRLAERWAKWEEEVGHYRQRPPIIEHFALLDSEGQPLTLEADTYPHLIRMHTAAGPFEWTFIDPETLLVKLPVGRSGFQFAMRADQAQSDRRGGTLRSKRSVAYTTSARLIENAIVGGADNRFQINVMLEADPGDALLLNVTPRLAFNRAIPPVDESIEAARARWQAWFDAAPPVLDEFRPQYEYAWWVMRAGLLNTRYYFTREACVPSKIHYVGVWHWDQFFHAIAYRHIDSRLAEDQIRIVLDHQRADGMLPDAIHDEGLVTHLSAPVDEDVTKPPLAAWTVLKLFEKSGHYDFLEEVYDATGALATGGLCSSDGMLCGYHTVLLGLDDSPLWDRVCQSSPDLNTPVHSEGKPGASPSTSID
jgi:hypothetical protein